MSPTLLEKGRIPFPWEARAGMGGGQGRCYGGIALVSTLKDWLRWGLDVASRADTLIGEMEMGGHGDMFGVWLCFWVCVRWQARFEALPL